MTFNPKKCHFITLENRNNLCDFSCDDIIIENSLSEKILGFTIDNNLDFSDNNLDFSDHISSIKNWKLYPQYQLIWTQIDVPYWLVFLLNLTSATVRLFRCSKYVLYVGVFFIWSQGFASLYVFYFSFLYLFSCLLILY